MSRRTWNRAWLVVALVIVGLAVAREARSFGIFGMLAPIVAVVVVVFIVGAVAPTWMRSSRPSAAPPAPRAVTPREPAIQAGSSIAPRPGPAPVVIIEPATDPGDMPGVDLEAKLATLDRLRGEGRLTDAEYEAKRAQLIVDF